MSGLADYVQLVPCPYPAIVAEWESIPQGQIESFTPDGFSQGDCFRGMGDYIAGWNTNLQNVSPSGRGLGLFDTGLDWTGWGIAEWLTIGFGLYVAGSVISDIGRGASKVTRGVRKRSARTAKRARLQKELADL